MILLRRLRFVSIFALMAMLSIFGWRSVGASGPAFATQHGMPLGNTAPVPRFRQGEILVKYKPTVDRSAIASSLAARGLTADEAIPSAHVYKVHVPVGQEMSYIAQLQHDPQVVYAEPNYILSALWTPNDRYYSDQWGMQKIGMPSAWNLTRGSSSVKVAIVDTGIDPTNPDHPANLVLDYDYVDGDWSPIDPTSYPTSTVNPGHGTHVAGIVAANTNNGIGVAGVAPGVTVIVIRALDQNGDGTTANLAAAVMRAADLGARVINMSWGSTSSSQTLSDAMTYANGKGALLVAAAGNSYQNGDPTMYPAAYSDNVMAVAATGPNDEQAFYSETGSWISVAAPGGDSTTTDPTCSTCILSTISTQTGYTYGWMEGTSMAAPHVTGLAALLFSENPNLTNTQVRSIIQNTAVDLGSAGKDNTFGYGRIDAAAAAQAAAPPPAIQTTPGSVTFMLQPTDSDQATQTIAIDNAGTGQLNWSAAQLGSSAWLSFSPISGTTPGTLSVTANKTGLAPGWYQDTIRISAAGATNSPVDVSVRLYIGPVHHLFLPITVKNSAS